MLTTLGLNSQHDWGEPIWLINEEEDCHFYDEWDIHAISKSFKEKKLDIIWIY